VELHLAEREGEVAALREAVAQLSIALQSLLAKVSATYSFPAGGAVDVHATELAPEQLLLVLTTDEHAPGPPDPPSGPYEARSFETPISDPLCWQLGTCNTYDTEKEKASTHLDCS
jgi:hypothetical protein